MANRKRDVQILLWVTPEEKKIIRKRMILSKTSNMSVYLRKMAIDGMIVNTDTTYLKAMYQEMHKIGVNINQLGLFVQWVFSAEILIAKKNCSQIVNQSAAVSKNQIMNFYPRIAESLENSSPLASSNLSRSCFTVSFFFSSPWISRMIFPFIIMIRRLP